MSISGYAALRARAKLTPHNWTAAPPGPHEVEIRITHCGLCRSDIHLIDNDWKLSRYPLVPGHEIIGRIETAGSAVQDLSIGARVGVGWQRGACFECDLCRRGDENLCARATSTCVGHTGGFAERIRIDGRFAFLIPEEIPSAQAAPLMCAGVTVFTPFLKFGVKPGMEVGIVGIGGLGHLAVQFAAALGCKVTALSSTPDKEAQSRASGAKDFLLLKDRKQLKKSAGRFDFLLSTVNADLDWPEILNLVAPDGKLCFVGVPNKPLKLPIYMLLDGRKSICGSPIGGRAAMNEMLAFAAARGVRPQVQTLPMTQVNDAIQTVRKNKARYRMVLEN